MNSSTISPGQILMGGWSLYRSDLFVLTAVPFLGNLLIAGAGLLVSSMTGRQPLFLDILFGPLIVAVTILLAADALAGHRRPFGDTLARVTPHFGRLVILSLGAGVLTLVGMVLLIVPGLYAAAVLLIYVPLILMDDAGWGALQKSYAYSKPYAWKLVLVILGICGVILGVLGLGGSILISLQASLGAPVLFNGLLLLLSAAFTGYYASVTYLVYIALVRPALPESVLDIFR